MTLIHTSNAATIANIEIDAVYYLDGKSPVTVLKALNRSKTAFSVKTTIGTIETIEAERLLPKSENTPTVEENEN